MKKDKKMAAALAAVSATIKSEEEAALAAAPEMATRPGSLTGLNLWGLSGRQSMMQMRNLMQLKSFSGFKLR